MNILYLVFGENFRHHQQAVFSILSFLKQQNQSFAIYVYTDAPDFYLFLKDKIKVVEVAKDKLKEWEGKSQFFWRVKIKAVQDLGEKTNFSPILYVDSDTFLKGNVNHICDSLLNNQAFMHEKEGRICELKSKTEKLMWKQCREKTFGNVKIELASEMWNAGVVAMPSLYQKECVATALEVCDEMCEAGVTRRLIEQFAFSVALKKFYDLREIKPEIIHYWGNKETWNEVIQQYLIENLLKAKNFDAMLSDLPTHFEASKMKVSNTKKKVLKWINKIWEDKIVE